MNFWSSLAACLLAVTTLAANTGSPTPLTKAQAQRLQQFKNSAPADQYFGRLKLSYLGINNTFRDASISAGESTTDPRIVNNVAGAVDALDDWARQYPRDPQLARSYFLAIRVEAKIWRKADQERAWTYINRVATLFPTSYFGKLIKKELAGGFTEHYFVDAVACPSPEPTATPSPEPTPSPTPSPTRAPRKRAPPTPSPSPSPTPTPPPTPAPTPTPVPEPTQVGPGLKVQVLTPPCKPA